MGRTLEVPLPMGGAVALAAGMEEVTLVASTGGTVEVHIWDKWCWAGWRGWGGGGGGSPWGAGASYTSAMSGYRSGRGGRTLSASKRMLGAVVQKMIQSPTVRAGLARWFVVRAQDQAGSRRRGVLGKALEPQIVVLVVPVDKAIGCGACLKDGIIAQPAAS